VAKLKTTPKGFAYPVAVEMWYYPDGSSLIELSMKVKPKQVERAKEDARGYLDSIGLKPGANSRPKRDGLSSSSRRR
jgi:hypothetical protein